jgi:hypothetical protein
LLIISTSEEKNIIGWIPTTKIWNPLGTPEKQKAQRVSAKPLKTMVPPERLELPTH